ncbi:MAG: Macrolide export protein MacA [Phycisphaerae bacterium]|nr:Macrolide export protein MacA [Phycisphaerae bacterium]
MIKKLLITILVLAVGVLGYFQLRSFRLSFTFTEGKTAKITRGDLTVPIEAVGEVLPARRIEIKAEASGEVLEILKQPGDVVQAGDAIIRLDREEEDRNLDRAQQEVSAAEARLERAKLTLSNLERVELRRANELVDQLDAQHFHAEFRLAKTRELADATDDELIAAQTNASVLASRVRDAVAGRDGVLIQIGIAAKDVSISEATLKSAQQTLGDARERLEKTEIRSPIDGMIGEMRTQVGEVIQGGKTTLTGGTLLATVIDTRKLIVRAEVDEAEIGRVYDIAPTWARPGSADRTAAPADWAAAAQGQEGLPVIRVDTFRDETFTGIIERILPEPKKVQEAVYYPVDVVLISENRGKLFKGMRADVTFTADRVSDVLLCPEEAIVEGPRGDLGVYVPDRDAGEEHATRFVACRLGLSNGMYSEVMEGLEEGAVVYTKLPVGPSNRDRK